MSQLTVSLSPHHYSKNSVNKLMYGVVLSLMPALAMSVYVFGIRALIVTATAVISCVLFEYLIQKFLLKTKILAFDGSAVITGILLAYNVPSNFPLWLVVLGSFVAIGIAKMSFGGLGNNPFNPALVGRVFLLASFPVAMTSWPKPFNIDGVTAATPLGIIKEGVAAGEKISMLMPEIPNYLNLFLGKMGGCIGEVSAAALLIGFIFLLWKKIVTWHIPVSMLGAMFIFSGILHLVSPEKFADPLFHLLTGGAMLGALYMATDYVTSPMTRKGMVIFGISIGILTILIRNFGAYPEGVSFAILIMNAFVPLIDKFCKPHRFGE